MITSGKNKQVEEDASIDNVFGDDEEEEEEEEEQQPQQSRKKNRLNVSNHPNSVSNLIAQRMKQEALRQDATVFQFDEVYDSMQQEKTDREQKQLQKRIEESDKSKYIGNLVKIAEERKREKERTRDRKMAKQLEKEKEIYGDTEVFVTSSYKKKLQEQQKWEEEEKKREEEERKKDVSKRGMSGFYNIARNIAFGGSSSGSDNVAESSSSSRLETSEDFSNKSREYSHRSRSEDRNYQAREYNSSRGSSRDYVSRGEDNNDRVYRSDRYHRHNRYNNEHHRDRYDDYSRNRRHSPDGRDNRGHYNLARSPSPSRVDKPTALRSETVDNNQVERAKREERLAAIASARERYFQRVALKKQQQVSSQ